MAFCRCFLLLRLDSCGDGASSKDILHELFNAMRGVSREAPDIIEGTLCKLSNVASGQKRMQQSECILRAFAFFRNLQVVDSLTCCKYSA